MASILWLSRCRIFLLPVCFSACPCSSRAVATDLFLTTCGAMLAGRTDRWTGDRQLNRRMPGCPFKGRRQAACTAQPVAAGGCKAVDDAVLLLHSRHRLMH